MCVRYKGSVCTIRGLRDVCALSGVSVMCVRYQGSP